MGGPARTNRRGELVVADLWTQLVFDGRAYVAGIGPEVTSIVGQTALDDLTPTIGVKAAPGKVVLIFAAHMSIDTQTEGGALANWDFVYDATDRTLTGTALTVSNLRSDQPNTPSSTFVHTGTAAAGTGINLAHRTIADNTLTAALDVVIDMPVVVFEPRAPIVLVDNGQFYVYSYTGTTGTGNDPAIYFAELDKADFV